MPCDNHLRRKQAGRPLAPKGGGGSDCPYMTHFGNFSCHRLVAYAWCKHPACAKVDPEWYKHYQADHINGDHGNWTADNLRWVTPKENIAWGVRQRALKKLALNLKWLNYGILRALSDLSNEQFDLCINRFRLEAGTSDDAITIGRINSTFAFLLDELKKQQQ